ncbi:PHP domain-containing protein [Cellulomonas triticagri]|uniref:PHP domain-containing protein n=1 Tax=Cellulomonas triticagri TaxID=2483352 RepID=A0A3M2IV08_9CELL|nr:PHP domain-containing protein [Cellulomonas triticagri]RMI04959.1 PHP domain-containing protein [Cellulomonas triticagri]
MADDTGGTAAVAALRRAAYLLERGGASSYRAEAFRVAVRTLERLPAGEVEARVSAGTLTDLPGIGARTAEVAGAAARGGPVPYVEDLERQYPAAEATGDGAVLHAALRGDLHAHSEASDGSTPIQEMVLAAMDLGHEYLAITDHSPRLTVANGLSAARLSAQLDQVAALNRAIAPFRVLTGIEVDILDDGGLDQDPALLDRLDVVVASVHSKLRMDSAAMTRRMRAAVANPLVDVLGHCTGRQLTGSRKRPPSDFDAAAVFADCAAHGVAVEVNCRPDRLDPPHALLDLAVAAGCTFTVDTDAHAPGQLAWQPVGCDRAAAHGIGPDDVLDAWPLDRLLGHLDGRRSAR